ncbi:MAG: hypothetical protein JNN08_30015 [Bryobacterales bacterium]|nr:hypothetical protein [Bryobacterales bacterium]
MSNREQHLKDGLLALREADAGMESPATVEALVRSEFIQRRRQHRVVRLLAWSAVAAAVVLAVALTTRPPRPVSVEQPRAASRAASTPVEPRRLELTTEFIPLQPAPADPDEFSQIIRVQLPRSELRRFGLAPFDQPLEGTVRADVVLGRDGRAQAVRFVY